MLKTFLKRKLVSNEISDKKNKIKICKYEYTYFLQVYNSRRQINLNRIIRNNIIIHVFSALFYFRYNSYVYKNEIFEL